MPTHLPLIEIDYNDVNSEGNTRFLHTDVLSDIPLIIGQYVTCYQPEDGTYVPGIIQGLGRRIGYVRVQWERMKGYTP